MQLLNDQVLPTLEKHRASVQALLSDEGRELCGRPDRRLYELFLHWKASKHRTTKEKGSQTNGFADRLHRTTLEEHFRVVGLKTWYERLPCRKLAG